MKDFRENYQQNLEADCDSRKDGIDDAGREELTEDCYNQLMEPYMDKADEEVQDKIHKIVAFYVKKYTNDPSAKNVEEPDGDDMDWSEQKKKDGSDDGDNEQENNSLLKRAGNHIGSWIKDNNDMMVKNGILNDQLYGHTQKTTDMLNAWKEVFGSKKKSNKSTEKKSKNTQKQPEKKAKKHEMDWS
jgi:hypothetical protein